MSDIYCEKHGVNLIQNDGYCARCERDEVRRDMRQRDDAFEKIERLQILIDSMQLHRMQWGIGCDCDCDWCEALDAAILGVINCSEDEKRT